MQELQASHQFRYVGRGCDWTCIERRRAAVDPRRDSSRARIMGMTMLAAPTRTDPIGPREWMIDDDVVRLREWGSTRVYDLPDLLEPSAECFVGSAPTCAIRLQDAWRLISRRHARLVRGSSGWIMQDAGSKNGLWFDNGRRLAAGLSPGVEVGIGSLTLIAESELLARLRERVSRLLGWREDRRGIVDRALRSIRASAMLAAPLLLHGDGNLVDIARQLHRVAFSSTRPFIVCDPRRQTPNETSRSAESRPTLAEALDAAQGGTVCVWASRLPHDYAERCDDARKRDVRARLVVCYRDPEVPPETWQGAIRIPPLSERVEEIDQLVDEYAADTLSALGRSPMRLGVSAHEREWLRRRRIRSVPELARAVERIVAIRELGTIERASQWLRISRVALSRWLNRGH